MTPYGTMLNDEEIASVLELCQKFIWQYFAPVIITADKVKAVSAKPLKNKKAFFRRRIC